MLEDQKGLCALNCGKSAHGVDHCHKTKTIRGLLCGPCNRAIGLFRDNPELLLRAAAYIKSFQ